MVDITINYLDCCDKPSLYTVKVIYESNHDLESLRICRNCGAYWFYRFHEYVSFYGDDDITVWYSPLTKDEAERIENAEDRPELSFLKNRESFMEDSQGVKKVKGQPDFPWS
ncbi:MAG: hypothetical protein EU547_00590 [Promethearchaeota archaeon]|nr:MAG: hypothetical protein EU547_00590 [Candidatus Lokiarchaeota archaeon]